MELKSLIKNLKIVNLKGGLGIEISDIIYDSRKVLPGCVFVCVKGSTSDGHKFADKALKKGAVALVVSEPLHIKTDKTILQVTDTREALARLSAAFFSHPARKLTTIGITGTKGKTTCTFMIKSILERSGIKTGIIGTIGVILGSKTIKTENTTPESYEIQKYLKQMVDEGYQCAVMEASSLGLKSKRLDAFTFDYGVFTNFSSDHIGGNEHEDLDEYLACKSLLFQRCRTGILNLDDPHFEQIIKGHTCQIITFGFCKNADFIAQNPKLISKPGSLGVSFDLTGKKVLHIDVSIPGKFSVYNALAALALCYQFKEIKDQAVILGLSEIKVKGRVESVPVPYPYTLLIDYAHNAVSMENVLSTLKEYLPSRLIVLFGAGGNRPKIRRYEMGQTAGRLADLSVITADNSRFEDVHDIIDDILVGMKKTTGKYKVIPERKAAIKYCLETAAPGDIVVLAGKGHEDYQEIAGVKHQFDERKIVAQLLPQTIS